MTVIIPISTLINLDTIKLWVLDFTAGFGRNELENLMQGA
jgi:hypothetical protein